MDKLQQRGNFLNVRGRRSNKSNPRLVSPPTSGNSHVQKIAAPKELSRPDVTVHVETAFEHYAGTAKNPRPSKFGGTDIERCSDNVASEALNFEFDAAQWVVNTAVNGSYTVIDRVLFHPRTAVYLDGIQHDIREGAEAQDYLQKLDLESQGWLVVRIKDVDIKRSPIDAVRAVLYAT